MSDIMAQLGFLAQSSDFEGWANLVFIAIMAVLWLVAGLAKTMGGKRSGSAPSASKEPADPRRRPGETWQQRLARRAEEWQRRLEEDAGIREARRRRPPARETASQPPQAPPGGRITVRTGPRGESIMTYERPEPQKLAQREHQVARQREAQRAVAAAGRDTVASRIEPARLEMETPELLIESIPPLMSEPPQPLDSGTMQLKAVKVAPESVAPEPGALIDYSDPDALKKAILHYEVLGKPLALRDSPEPSSF
jgi:hypothetical protein